MSRLLLIIILIITHLYAEDVDKKIKTTSHKLNTFSKSYLEINAKMAKTAKAIMKQKRELYRQNMYLYKLQVKLKDKETSYKEDTKKLKGLLKKQEELEKKQKQLEEELVFFLAKNVSLSIILEEDHTIDTESLMAVEILKSMSESSKAKAKELNKRFFANSKDVAKLKKSVDGLKHSILSIDMKRKDVIEIQDKNKKDLAKLNADRNEYKKQLEHLLKKQDSLKKTLEDLNILKIDLAKKAKEEAERKAAFEKQRKMLTAQDLPKVKQHATSYQAIKTKRYTGPKTSAPLDDYTITKKYGTYKDPIYGIKIFNESISLKPKKRNEKVKTVFNGKVIYADKTAVLNNIVIVEHKGGLHTIYANLSQIAPNIEKGVKIKKGHTIGRVVDELIFEVTLKSDHINPIRLFQ